MKLRRAGWALWAMIPVGVLFFHFGPGQAMFVADRAARVKSVANDSEATARAAQDAAYEKHLAAIKARRKAFLSQAPEDEVEARVATEAEASAYAVAAEAWKKVADQLNQVLEVLGDSSPEQGRRVRWARSRALVRSGDVWGGIGELEAVLGELDKAGESRGELARSTREELATAYYYGARLLRLSGMPPQEWLIESGKARQHFRYLAEHAGEADPGASGPLTMESAEQVGERALNYKKNLEQVLNLEQSTLAEIQGRPLPKDSPRAGNAGNRPGNGPPRKSKRPPDRRDGRGAGGAGEIPEGW